MSRGAGPYREGGDARHVCIVCYHHVSAYAGLCPRCSVDLLPLDDPEVRAEVRAEAERRLQKRMYGEYFALSLTGFALATPVLWLFGELGYLAAALLMGQALTRGWTAMRPSSALALYARRRRRLQLELAGRAEPRALPAAGAKGKAGEGDPEELDLAETLRWLGLDEPT